MENKKLISAIQLISAKSWQFFRGIAMPGIFKFMKYWYQWFIDHPQEVYQGVKLLIEIYRRFRRRKKRNQDNDPGSVPNSTPLPGDSCILLPIPGGDELPKTPSASVSAPQTKRLFPKKPKKKRSYPKK